MTTPESNKGPDFFVDIDTLLRSALDAMNLINFRWFLYDEARRSAWLEQHGNKPPNDQPASVAGFKDRRMKVRRIAKHGLSDVTYHGENLRHQRDRRTQKQVA